MASTLARQDYERQGFPDSGTDTGERQNQIDAQYPKSTGQTSIELRARGIDVTPEGLNNLVNRGAIDPPTGESGKNRAWTKHDVDRAFEYLNDKRVWTPGAMAFEYFGIDAAQEQRARHAAFEAHPEIPYGATEMLVMELQPCALGVGVHRQVTYRVMTSAERSQFEKRIETAKRIAGDRNS